MFQLLRNSLSITRHTRKGVYVCKIGGGKKSRHPGDPLDEVVYTLREGGSHDEDECHVGNGGAYGPITMSYQGARMTLRPWDPKACIIAAGICNQFVNWPIQPGSWVFVVDCSLNTLSHIA